MVKKSLLALAALLALLGLGIYHNRYTLAGTWFLPRDGMRPAEHRVCIDSDLAVPMPDGIVLRSHLYRPCTHPTAPTILVRIPFSRGVKNELGAGAIASFWAARGYNVVVQGTRGRYKSDGIFYPLRHERRDGLDTLAWLRRQTWFDGRLGLWGGSAFGHTAWAIADQTNAGPLAFHLQIVSTSFREMLHQGGAFALESALYWAVRSHGDIDIWPTQEQLDRGIAGWPMIEADDRAVRDVGFFNDWVRNPQHAPYWKEIDGEDRARSIKGPVLLLGGWQDPFLPTLLRDFMTIRSGAAAHIAKSSRLIIGPWTHADTIRFPDGTTAGDYRPESVRSSLPWFDHHLMSRPADRSITPPVQIFVLGENVWRAEQEWPLARARETSFHLVRGNSSKVGAEADHQLLATAPTAAMPALNWVHNPLEPVPTRGGAMLGNRAGIRQQNDVEAREDVLVFTSSTLTVDTEVTGPVHAELHVATTAPSTDFVVKLVDVLPDGRAFNVTDGILRQTYDAGSTRPTAIRVELNPTSMLFRKGHRIRVEIASSNYPRFDINPGTGRDLPTETQPVTSTQTLFVGDGTPSRVVLPLVPRP